MVNPLDPPQSQAPDRAVEATRYAVLRRLALAMRHQMVVHLQPIGMITEVMERRLKAPAPDLAQVHESMGKIHGFSRSAVDACLDVITWLAPDGEHRVPLAAAVEECTLLLRSNFSFLGFALRHEAAAGLPEVPRAALRHVLPACLLALSDEATAPAEVVVAASADGHRAVVEIRVEATEGPVGFVGERPYRTLQWAEVQALARAEGMEASRDGGRIRLLIPIA